MPDGQFFVLDSDLVDDELVAEGPSGVAPTVDAKIFHVELATLGEILGAGSFDDLVVEMELHVRSAAHGEAGLLRVPTVLRDALAALDQVDTVATRWAATEELELWTVEDCRGLLLELKSLASGARNDAAELWLWSSL